MLEAYIVTREGVYRHEIIGVFTSHNLANAGAMRAIQVDEDSYHRYIVRKYEIDHIYAERNSMDANLDNYPDGELVAVYVGGE